MGYHVFMERVARKAGEIMLQYFHGDAGVEFKDDTTPLTIADTTINQMVIDEINKTFPEHSIKGEEQSDIRESEYTWVCDPIDGTMPYTCKIPISVFALALCKNGVVIAGVLYDPYMDRLAYAEKGFGTFLNGKKVHVNSKDTLSPQTSVSIVCTKRNKYDSRQVYEIFRENGIVVYALKSILYAAILIAQGTFEAIVFPGTTEHDAAAAKIIVEEAGGKVTDIFGEEQRYDQPIKGYIASNGSLHDELVEICKDMPVRDL